MNNVSESIIQVRDLKAGYGEKVILQDINFEVRRGEVFVILGGSGCGKSTLLKNLIGLYAPLAGEVWIEGSNLVAARDDQRLLVLRKRLAALDCGIGLDRAGRGLLALHLDAPLTLSEVPTAGPMRAAHEPSGDA